MSAQTYAGYTPDAAHLGGLFSLADRDDLSDYGARTAAMLDAMPEDADSVFEDAEDGDEEEAHLEPEARESPIILTPHPYQEKAITSVLREFQQKIKSTLVVSATGTGKSLMLAWLAERAAVREHGVLILVHRDELIQQLKRSCSMIGLPTVIEQADNYGLNEFGVTSKTVIASVQTMKGKRLEQWPKNAFKLVIVDECHHAIKGSAYEKVIQYFGMEEGRLRVAGFTATADRLDGKNIGAIFETLAFEYNLRDATRDGWLVPIEAVQLKTDPKIDLRDLRVTQGGDLNREDLERAVNDNIGVLVNALRDTNALEERRTICFAPDIESSRSLAAAMNDVGISAIDVAGSDADRQARFKAHQRGEFQVLVNCAVATEGYDDPLISAVLICRPTKSRGLYSQMVGRGTRLPREGDPPKANCRVVDFAFLTGDLQLVSPVDLFDNAETPDEVVAEARELLASGRVKSIDEALDLAACDYETQRRARIQRRAVSVKAAKFDPLTACEIYGVQQKMGYDFGNGEPATEKQVEALVKRGIAATPEMGKAVASKLLNKLFARQDHGWASPWQVKDLIQSGVDIQTATGMREPEARAYLDAHPVMASDKQVNFLVWKGWKKVDAQLLTKKQAIAAITAAKASESAT